MGLDIEKVAMLTSMVDKLIQMKRVDNALDESVVEDLIQKSLFISGVPYSDDEIAAVKRDVAYKYQIQAHPGESILADYEQTNWYDDRKAEIQQNFWTRYKNYLIDEKHFSPNVVSTLGNDTLDQKLMNYILDPKADYGKPVLKRGLIIGDVQSGKTSTYIGFICKAADAGYKVFILLTGTIESLRQQTQERVEEGFIGIDMSANTTGGKRVGVGLDNKPIHAMALTSRASDFRGNSDKIAVSLGADKDAVVFVIKKNTTTLTKLTKWLIDLNADPRTHKIDMPMLMIDDEADNASINTSSDKEDPTKINKLIRKLADVFTKSNYVGFTATPFANVFIDPETTEKMETHDLFPEDFIVALPTPSNYIGPTRIFPKDAEFHSQLVYITDAGREEEDGYSFYFKHKKDWKGKLPESMTDAIYAFYLANAIRDLLRNDYRNPIWFEEAVECTPNDTVSRRKIWEDNPQIVLEGNIINPEIDTIRTITTKQDRNPNSGNLYFDSGIEGKGKFRYLTPRECMLFMGFKDMDYWKLKNNNVAFHKGDQLFSRDKIIRMAGNSIPVKLLEGVFWQILQIDKLMDKDDGCSQ